MFFLFVIVVFLVILGSDLFLGEEILVFLCKIIDSLSLGIELLNLVKLVGRFLEFFKIYLFILFRFFFVMMLIGKIIKKNELGC